jgi:hypothetical protein
VKNSINVHLVSFLGKLVHAMIPGRGGGPATRDQDAHGKKVFWFVFLEKKRVPVSLQIFES